jgi:hypothetical protein
VDVSFAPLSTPLIAEVTFVCFRKSSASKSRRVYGGSAVTRAYIVNVEQGTQELTRVAGSSHWMGSGCGTVCVLHDAWFMVSMSKVFNDPTNTYSSFFHSGQVRRKSALSVQLQTVIAFTITSIVWYVLGFSLALSPSGSWFIGNFHNAALRNVLTDELREGGVPPLLLFAHHNMVACARYG